MHHSGPLPLAYEGLEQGFLGEGGCVKTAETGVGENLDYTEKYFKIRFSPFYSNICLTYIKVKNG